MAVLMLVMAEQAAAQQQQRKQPAPQAPAQPAQPTTPAMPDAIKLNLLIRSSIIALNQANQTGNYTVLQDLGAPAFRAGNDSARLAQIFAALRQRQIDLSPVLFFTPKLLAEPQLNPNGLLRLSGYFPTTPERVNFELIFQRIGTDWRIYGIGVNLSPADVTAALADQPQAAAPQPAPQAPNGAAPRAGQTNPPKAAAKPDAAPAPGKKPAASAQNGRPAQTPAASAAAESKIQNGTTNNVARIDLTAPPPGGSGAAQGWSAAEGAAAEPAQEPSGFLDSLNPFSGN
ncbi:MULTISPECIES: hypothetical protein [Rhodomicrobium]|uniref:hypothetical protein n=1 Tax=Rhodomicrobium TaxID=1068 RepID=UPI000B4AED34|nr:MULTISPECIES: hypothetical protein [Rhodomicrobium]